MAEPASDDEARMELWARYRRPESVDAAPVLALLGKPDLLAVDAMAYRYSNVDAFEAFARSNRERHHLEENGIQQLGPAMTDDGVFGVLLFRGARWLNR